MEESVRGAVIRAVQDGGELLRSGSRRDLYSLERRVGERMRAALRSADPSISEWGEEGQDKAFSICPLDSAANYSSGFGSYGLMAAYIEGGIPVFGALAMPGDGLILTAERGKGARNAGRKMSVGGRDRSRAIVSCDCTAYMQNGKGMFPLFVEMIEALSKGTVQWRNTGSPAESFASLAGGVIDAFVSPLRDASHAAGYLIMEEAGAELTDGDGRPFTLASGSVLAASPALHEDLLRLLKGAL